MALCGERGLVGGHGNHALVLPVFRYCAAVVADRVLFVAGCLVPYAVVHMACSVELVPRMVADIVVAVAVDIVVAAAVVDKAVRCCMAVADYTRHTVAVVVVVRIVPAVDSGPDLRAIRYSGLDRVAVHRDSVDRVDLVDPVYRAAPSLVVVVA